MIAWKNLIGQNRVKNILDSAFKNGALAHAYLFCGDEGAGKFAAALDLAAALLCLDTSTDGAKPCGECASCKKINSYSHPDFHLIMPVVLAEEHKKNSEISDNGWQFIAETASSRVREPYALVDYEKTPNIPVDWIREATAAIRRGATEGSANVLVIDCVDTMKDESANAMLKTLEEPPQGSVLLLLTDKAHSVLPTIVSRCQQIRFAPLPPDVICAELARRFDAKPSDPRVVASAFSTSLGVAIDEYENSRDEYFRTAAELWNDCKRGDFESAAKCADYISYSKEAFSECRKILRSMLELIRAAYLSKTGDPSKNYIKMLENYPMDMPENVTPQNAESYIKICQDAIGALNARGNASLVMVNFVCSLMEMLNVEKQ